MSEQAAAASGQLRGPRPPPAQPQNGLQNGALLEWGKDPFWQVRWCLEVLQDNLQLASICAHWQSRLAEM